MDKITFLDKSHAGAIAVRNSMGEKFSDRCSQIKYADTVLRGSLISCGLLDTQKLNQRDLVSGAQPPDGDSMDLRRSVSLDDISCGLLDTRKLNQRDLVSGAQPPDGDSMDLRRSVSLDDFAMRQIEFDPDTADRVRRFLDGNLPDYALLSLGEEVERLRAQLSRDSLQYKVLTRLLNFIDAQGSIVLGYTEDILTPRNQSGDVVAAIGWALWSIPTTDFLTWGVVFGKRIDYVLSQGGDITFILPEGKNGRTFTAQGAYTSYIILKETLEQIDAMPELDYKSMLSGVMKLSKIDDPKDLRILYAYHVFDMVYGSLNRPNHPIASNSFKKEDINNQVKLAIRLLNKGKLWSENLEGATTHFELAYLLHTKTKFKIAGSEEKIQSFRDFPTTRWDSDHQKFCDPDRQEFRDSFRELATPFA